MTDAIIKRPDYLPKYARDEEREYRGDPWTRQPGESTKAFAAFQCYLAIEPEERTLTKAEIAYRDKVGLEQKPGTTMASRWSRIHRWAERAEAYDAYVTAKLRNRLERKKLKAAEQHAAQMDDALHIATAPASKLAERMRKQLHDEGIDFLDKLDEDDLMKLFKMLGTDVPAFQKAQREALASVSGPSTQPQRVKARGEMFRKLVGNPEMLGLMERIQFEVTEEVEPDQEAAS